LALGLLIGFTCGTVYAQVDLSIWNNSLWQIKQTAKGVVFSDPTNEDLPPAGNARGTEQIWGVMTVVGVNIYIQIYENLDGVCEAGDLIPLTYQEGGPLGFVATLEADTVDHSVRGLFYISGKMKNGLLNTGKITSLGGYILQRDWFNPIDLAAYGFSLTGTLQKKPKGCLPNP
jgi:hypothetical protein